jgi:hypothetical protein
MPAITITLSDAEHRCLNDDYKEMVLAWPRLHARTPPPRFEEWLVNRALTSGNTEGVAPGSIDEARLYDAIEQVVTSLRPHGFGLMRPVRSDKAACAALAADIAGKTGLGAQHTKRLQELLDYYARDAKELADLAQLVLTSHTYDALHENLRELKERTGKALGHLGEEQALGRIEGALAILVGLQAMSRQSAREQAALFKQHMRDKGG